MVTMIPDDDGYWHVAPIIFAGWAFYKSRDKWVASNLGDMSQTFERDTMEDALACVPDETWAAYRHQSDLKQLGGMTVEGEDVMILTTFPVYHLGWECDAEGWIVRAGGGKIRVVLSSHTRPYFADRDEVVAKLKEYREVIEKTETALLLLGEE